MTGSFSRCGLVKWGRGLLRCGILMAALLSAAGLYGQRGCDCETYSRLLKREAPFQAEGLVNIVNKYGPVFVEGWDKDRIRVETLTEVQAASEAGAHPVFERIHTEMNLQQRLANIHTQLGEARSNWWSWPGMEPEDYTVSIKVFLPRRVALNLDNKQGDVYLANLEGSVKAKVNGGDVDASYLSGQTIIQLRDGNANLEGITRLKAEWVNVEGHLKKSAFADIKSSYSTLYFREVREVKSVSRYDTYFVDQVVSFSNQGRYDELDLEDVARADINSALSRIFVAHVRSQLTVRADSSDVYISELPPGFERVVLEGRFTDFELKFDPGTPFVLDAEGRYAGIRYPGALHINSETEVSNRHAVRGYLYADRPGVGRIEARLTYGALSIEKD